MTNDAVSVTGADRKLIANIIRRIDPSEDGSRMARNVLDKNHDDDPSVIEAAQHRLSAIAPGGAASVEREARELLAREYEKGDRAFMADRIRRGNTSPVDDRAIRAVEAALAASSMDTKKARLATLRAADEISAMLEDGDMKHRSKLIDLADTLRDAALATSSPVDAEKVREIEILRRALAWHGDPQRMATTREEWQQTIDAAIVWVKANPEPDRPSFSTYGATSSPVDAEKVSPEDAWQDLVDKDDRTSPEEYPNMALITRDELFDYMRDSAPSHIGNGGEGASRKDNPNG